MLILTGLMILVGLLPLWAVARGAVRLVRGLFNLIEDWRGEPPRPGFAGRPGVPERLATVESNLRTIKCELRPDAGSTLRDAIDRVERQTEAMSHDQHEHEHFPDGSVHQDGRH